MIRTFRAASRFTPPLSRPSTRFISPTITQRTAHQGYGNRESGHEASDEALPTSNTHEHPGPESPVSSSGGGKQTQTSSSSSSSSTSSSGPRSTIHKPPEPDEHANEEVRRHNEELRRSHDQAEEKSPGEEKVDKKFWQGKWALPLLPLFSCCRPKTPIYVALVVSRTSPTAWRFWTFLFRDLEERFSLTYTRQANHEDVQRTPVKIESTEDWHVNVKIT